MKNRLDAWPAQMLKLGNKKFPERLKKIDDPPKVLWVEGNADLLLSERCVAIVGTRHPTLFGLRKAYEWGAYFAKKGWLVVSGLARGCDTAAHEGCLSVKGQTLAFLAHGLDTIYPPENESLAQRILDQGGCLVSEYPLGTPPCDLYFKERDRLQSGLSLGVLAVEADLESGTMHTMRYALLQKKALACLAHPKKYWSSPVTRGNRQFLKEGKAMPIQKENDLEGFIFAMEKGIRK